MKTITMKGKTNHDFGLEIRGADGGSFRPLSATQTDEWLTIPGRGELIHRPGNLESQIITINFLKRNKSMEQWQSDRIKIAGWLHSEDLVKIQFDDEPGLHYVGRFATAELPTMFTNVVTFSVEIIAQPFRYSDDKLQRLTLTDGKATINNKGNYKTPYELTITVLNSASKLDFSVGNAKLTYNASVSNGDVITIDTDSLEFRLNDELKVIEVSGVFALLRPGTNVIQSNVSGQHDIVYRERTI